MNKYEKHLYIPMVIGEYVLTWLKYHRAYCHVDDLLANPAIFPEQTWSLAERTAWALDCKLHGEVWVVSCPPMHKGCMFSLQAQKRVPDMNYKHISKVWRLANESV